MFRFSRQALFLCIALLALAARAADFPAPREGSWIAKDFRFHTCLLYTSPSPRD